MSAAVVATVIMTGEALSPWGKQSGDMLVRLSPAERSLLLTL